MRARWLPRGLALILGLLPSRALGQTPGPEDPQVIDRRLVEVVESAPTIAIEEGDTIFVERRESVSRARFTKKASDYEGQITGITSPRGVVVHARLDRFVLEPAGDKMNVTLRYAIHVDPGVTSGGRVSLTLTLLERTGLANVVVQTKVGHSINVTSSKPKVEDLAADFYGYRLYQRRVKERIPKLERAGVRGLTLADEGRVPALDRVSGDVAETVYELERERRRMWIAHRHLISARANKNPAISGAAAAYLANLDKPDSALSNLPVLASKAEEPARTEAPVERLKPQRVEPAGDGAAGAGTLNPVGAYEHGSDSEDDEPLTDPEPRRDDPRDKPKTPAKPGEGEATADGTAEGKPIVDDGTTPARLDDDLLAGRRGREIVIPSYARSLVLDDPNIAHAASVRLGWATVTQGGFEAVAPAIFYGAQVSVTKALGIEVSVPTTFVSLGEQRAAGPNQPARVLSTYVMGNPLFSAKYRIHLPEVEGRQPALTLRARWGLPLAPPHKIPPTQRTAEEFSFPAHFVDTWAFLNDKTDLGLGMNAAWQIGMFYSGLQLYGDYYLPVANAIDQTSFPTLSWGASVGVLPLDELLGVYLEGRATTLFTGPTRTEFFTYLGARSRFLDFYEVAVWGSMPIGSVGRVSGVQFGAELRFAYDIDDVITLGGRGARGQDDILRE